MAQTKGAKKMEKAAAVAEGSRLWRAGAQNTEACVERGQDTFNLRKL